MDLIFCSQNDEHERLLGILDAIEQKAARQKISPEEERLSDLLFALIQPYEDEQYKKYKAAQPPIPPLEELKVLMKHRDLKQKDIWHLFGSKGVASEVLSGKRQVSKAHAKKLAEYFNVSVEVFI